MKSRAHHILAFGLWLIASAGFCDVAAAQTGKLSSAPLKRNYRDHDGYLESVKGERKLVFEDLVFVPEPKDDSQPLSERIFTNKLTKEFREEYDRKFGRTEAERVYYAPNKLIYYGDKIEFDGTNKESNEEKRRFGEYMGRRLLEHHVDNYVKNDPDLRPAYEMKERLSNVKVKVANRVQLKAKYSISGNYLDFKLENPWADANIKIDMKETVKFEEVLYSISKQVTQKITLATHFAMYDGVIKIVGTRAINERLSTSLSSSTNTKPAGRTQRESLTIAGVNYIF